MGKFIYKIFVLSVSVLTTICLLNFIVDPSNLYRGNSIIEQMVNLILDGKTIIYPGDFDERQFKRSLISTTTKHYDVGIVGSSHVMYVPFEYDNYMNFGMSESDLSDYYNIIGELDYFDNLPDKLIFGIDTWFADDDHLTGRSSNNLYSNYLYNKVKNNELLQVIDVADNGYKEKVFELFSIPYFQSSIKNLFSKGIIYYFMPSNRIVHIAESERPLQNNHLLTPTCQLIMYLAGEKSLKEKDNSVNSARALDQMYGHKQTGFNIDDIKFDEFDVLIEYLQSKGVEIEFYLPSMYPSYWDYMVENPKYNQIMLLEPKLRDYAERRKIIVRGTYNPYKSKVTKEDFYDELHMYANKMWENFNFIANE